MHTSFNRELAPDLMDTDARETPWCFAIKAMSSSLALPSTGGDFSFAISVPSSSVRMLLSRERGATLTFMIRILFLPHLKG